MIDQSIADFMNPNVLHGDESTSMLDVDSSMHLGADSAFIVCDDGAPVGTITERDAVSLLGKLLNGGFFEDTRANEIMTSPFIHCPSRPAWAKSFRS